MRTTLLGIGLALVLAGPSAAAPAGGAAPAATPAAGKPGAAAARLSAADDKIASQLKAFCVKWMGFLATRERDNRKAIKWQAQADGVKGQYVGYSTDYECNLKERSSNGTPVATIVYREYVYEQHGASKGDAEASEPKVVDATEVTEIFRSSKGAGVC
jgi:hypothetical protein